MFGEFKKPMFSWLQLNKFLMNKIFFKSSKGTMVCVSNLMTINPFWISRTQFQEYMNMLMESNA
eukprot:12164434-Ditylum_brightwellii.AAC.1